MLCTYNCVIHIQLCYAHITVLYTCNCVIHSWLPCVVSAALYCLDCLIRLLTLSPLPANVFYFELGMISSCVIYVNLSLLSKNVYRDSFFLFFRPVLLLPVLILPLEFNLEYKMSIVMLIRRIHLKSQRRSLRATNPISAIKMLKVRLKSRNLELNLQNSKFKLEFAAFKILRRKSIITAFKTGLLSLRPLS